MEKYVAVTGNDLNDGSLESPLRNIQYAIALLSEGDTLYIREGVYKESKINFKNKKNITVKNYQGERVVIDCGYDEFKFPWEWELVDTAKGIYRSVKQYTDVSQVRGFFIKGDKKYRLVPYIRYGDLESDNEKFTPDYYMYVGPGVFYNQADKRIYCRLKYTAILKDLSLLPPSVADPNYVSLYLYPDWDCLIFPDTASNITVEGLTLRSGHKAIYIKSNTQNITIKNCDILGGRTHIYCDTESHDLVFDGIVADDCIPPWIGWEDVKEHTEPPGEKSDYVAGDMKTGFLNCQDGVYNVTIQNCVVNHTFDGILLPIVHHIKVINNTFRGTRDDSIELETGSSNIEIAYNKFLKVSKAISRRDYGKSPQYPGTKYIHHNIIDCDVMLFHGREGSKIYERTSSPKGFISNTAFGTHGRDNPGIGDPWKIYNNTIVIGHAISGSPSEKGIGVEYHYKNFIKGNPQEVYNNIFIGMADSRLVQDVRTKDGSQIFDGNMYWRTNGKTTPMFVRWNCGNGKEDFVTLNEFKNKYPFSSSPSLPPFENFGIEGDPALGQDYIPTNTLPYLCGVILKDMEWPDNDSEFVGALKPELIPVPEPEPIPEPTPDNNNEDLEKLKNQLIELRTFLLQQLGKIDQTVGALED